MSIFKSENSIQDIYYGSSQVIKVFKKNILIWKYKTNNPTITITNIEHDSVVFNLKNNDNQTATIYYELNNPTPNTAVSVASQQTVSITITGLNSSENYTIYARAQSLYENTSDIVSQQFSTGEPPQWNTFATYQKSDKNASPWTTINNRDWWAPTLNNSTIYAQQWRVVATAQTGQTSNEYWQELELVDYDGNTYNSTAASNLSLSGYITSYISIPQRAFDNNYSLPGGTFAASISSGNHVGSTMSFDFNSPIRLNVIRLQTGYTKISQMEIQYFG